MKRIVIGLLGLSVVVYALQLIIFKDPNTTAFYILQDVAFLPISIAVATIVVGEFLSSKEKMERQEKTQMLTSSFFTEMGSELLQNLIPLADHREELVSLFENSEVNDVKSLDKLRGAIREIPVHIALDRESYEELKQIICGNREILLIISSNPLLLDHADFTKLIWGLFHLQDEFRLRGSGDAISSVDLKHLEDDFSEITILLLLNWSRNVLYTKKNYPNYYNAAVGKLWRAKKRCREEQINHE